MTVFIFGEAMLEYHHHGGTGLRYGGDTLNTAIHMARAGIDVAYVTAVGTDAISDALIQEWSKEGIDTRYVLRHPTRSPGIYAIHLDEKGERSFLYWRDQSAARDMFALPGMAAVLNAARSANLLYYSLITSAIIGEAGRELLFNLAQAQKDAGQMVAYDSNFRPLLWSDIAMARAISEQSMRHTTIGLPTNVDETQLYGQNETDQAIALRWRAAGCEEVAVKAGEMGCVLSIGDGAVLQYPTGKVDVVDSSGAGDAFNAGYLIARMQGGSGTDCCAAGHALAAKTLGHFGAINLQQA